MTTRRFAVRSVIAAAAVLCIAGVCIIGFAPSAHATDRSSGHVVSIELVGGAESRFVVDDRTYRGPIVITRYDDGLAFTERASVEQYLEGIAEVPFSWPEASLEAQVVAARTYLVRTLAGGRSGDGRTYGFDICATSRCQVYRGVDLVEGSSGDRWRDAVRGTEDVLVLHEGRPIEAVYSSMHGSRSRANQDVWASDPVPYLQPVDSPEVGRAPFAEWRIEVTADQFVQVARAGGLDVGGELLALDVDDPPEGAGRTSIVIVTTHGTDSVLAPALRGVFNRHADDLYPGSLPADRPGGGRYPQVVLSHTYDIEHISVEPRAFDHLLPGPERIDRDLVRFDGEGWGHGVGMSQWGARIMAEEGATHGEILEHYYTGTTVVTAPQLVPDEVVVGLAWGRSQIRVEVAGGAELRVNGVPFTNLPDGGWILRSTSGGIGIVPVDPSPAAPRLGDRAWPR